MRKLLILAIFVLVVGSGCDPKSAATDQPSPSPVSPSPSIVSTYESANVPAPSSTDVVQTNVHPGAFCSNHFAQVITSTGKLMICTTSSTDSAWRWRAK